LGSILLADDSFDKPLRQTIVRFEHSAYIRRSENSRILLYCSYYKDFMIKQLDDPGMKGTRWVTMTPINNGQTPPCLRSHATTERFIEKGWWSFIGVKRQLLFLEAADGQDGGEFVRIFNLKTRRKIFEDSVSLAHFRIDFADTSDGRMSM